MSYGLPQMRIINRTFLCLMMGAGMDAAIMDPLDKLLMASLRTAKMLCGEDEYCMGFITGTRSGVITS